MQKNRLENANSKQITLHNLHEKCVSGTFTLKHAKSEKLWKSITFATKHPSYDVNVWYDNGWQS